MNSFRPLVTTAALVFAAGCAAEPPADRIRVSGHVEATEVRLAPDAGGRILSLTLREGDRVEPGQLVLTLDARDVERPVIDGQRLDLRRSGWAVDEALTRGACCAAAWCCRLAEEQNGHCNWRCPMTRRSAAPERRR